MKLKKFNEFFDSEELRDEPEHELMKMTGDISYNFGKKIDYDFKTENIGNFITKISDTHFAFMRAFSDASNKEGGEIKFSNFVVFSSYDEEEGYYNFTAKSDDYFLVLGLKINSMNDYDVYVYVDDIRDEESLETFEEEGVTYMDIVHIITDIYLPQAKKLGFEELLKYNIEDIITKSN